MKRKIKHLAFFGLLMVSIMLIAAVLMAAASMNIPAIGIGLIGLAMAAVFLGGLTNQVGALSADRNTPQRSGDSVVLGVAASTKIYAGSLVARNATGYAVPGAVSTTLRFIGRAADQVDNSSGADNAKTITIEKGIFKFGNYASDLIAIADVGNDCYIYDDAQVAKTSATSTRSVAGKVFAVDSDGVWVDMRA